MLDPSNLTALAALPWQLQLVLGSGYIAYLLAFVGIRHTHKAADTVFGTLAFGLFSLATLALLPATVHWIAGAALAIVAALCAAIIWRWIVRRQLRKALRWSGYSWADDTPSAWDRLLECEYKGVTQLSVELDYGRYLHSTEAKRLEKLPYGPFVLGTSGDILMYVDQRESAGGEVDQVDGVFDDAWGDLLTYIPAGNIKALSIRLKS